jgi:hypothetical protein
MLVGGGLLIALFLQSSSAAPAAPPETNTTKARLDLRGGADCISRGDVVARVAARSARIRFVDDASIDAHVVVTSTRPGNVIAEVVLATPGAEQQPRRFAGRTCAEAADAIALIIAITLDPTLKRPGTETASAAGGAADGGAERAPPLTEKPAEPPIPPKPPAPPTTVESAPPAPPFPSRREYGVWVTGQTIFGPAPAVMPGIGISGMVALERGGVWSPALLLGATHVWRNDLAETGGSASFTLDAASVDACPLRVTWSAVVARPCASALVGRLNASGSNTEQGDSVARPFATGGVALAASAGRTVEVTARVGIGVTLLRDAYEFGGMTFHRASPITAAVSLGVGLHWP